MLSLDKKVLAVFSFSVFAAFGLLACGDDSAASVGNEEISLDDVPLVESFDDLITCNKNRDGLTSYVKKDKLSYVCEDGDWVVAGDKSSPRSSSVSSDDDDTPKSSSSKVRHSSSSFEYKQSDDAFDNPDIETIKHKTVRGLAQKGPYATGGTVTLYELDGKTLEKTGKTFTAKISDDKGSFKVADISLESQYALITVKGAYFSEISGDKISNAIELNAITDLSNRENVNVNILTHLEYERVLYLMSTGINMASAKKQAEAEVFNAFYIPADFATAESLNLFGKGESSAALLAISVLTQSVTAGTMFTEFMAEFNKSFKETGEWKQKDYKGKISVWACSQDSSGVLSKFRERMAAWNAGTVPDYEGLVKNFWYQDFGLGYCDEDGEIKLDTNFTTGLKFQQKAKYICESGAWREADDFEKDTQGWGAAEDGDVAIAREDASHMYVYDAEMGKWRTADTLDFYFGGCTVRSETDIERNVGYNREYGWWYVCKDQKWVRVDASAGETHTWIDAEDGEVRKGKVTGHSYKYDKSKEKWLNAKNTDILLEVGCTQLNEHKIIKKADSLYVCRQTGEWEKGPTRQDSLLNGHSCTKENVGEVLTSLGDIEINLPNIAFYCSVDGWINFSSWSWAVPREAFLNPDIDYGTLKDPRDGKEYKTVVVDGKTWMAQNLNYSDSVKTPALLGKTWCLFNTPEYCEMTGRLYSWSAAVDSVALANDAKNPVDCGDFTSCSLSENVQGVCPDGWRLPSSAEVEALIEYAGGFNKAAEKLKSVTGWGYNSYGRDLWGFSMIGSGGIRSAPISNHYFKDFEYGTHAALWTADEYSNREAYVMKFTQMNDVKVTYSGKSYGVSVRCIKN